MLRKAPFCMGNFSKNFLNFFSPDGSRIRFPLPGKRRELHHGSAFFASLPSSVVSISPPGKRRGTASGKRLFCISSILGGFDSPYRGNEGERHQEPGRALFSYKRGPLAKYPTGIFCNSPPKMRPTERRFRPLRRATRATRPGSSLPLRSAPWLCATGTRRPRQAEPGRNPRL